MRKIFKHPRTTLAGLGLLVIGIAKLAVGLLVTKGHIDAATGGFIIGGLGLVGSADSANTPN